MAEFIWRPQDSYTITNEPRVRVASYGDGYEQRAKDGINNQLKTYQFIFRGLPDDIQPIQDFLVARGAVESFQWNSIYENKMVTMVCRSWSFNPQRMKYEITATFEEVVA